MNSDSGEAIKHIWPEIVMLSLLPNLLAQFYLLLP